MTPRADEPDEAGPGAGEQTGEAVGGIAGVLAGAGIGSAAGPLGTILGGVAGAVGGWWAGDKAAERIGESLESWAELEEEYRTHWDAYPGSLAWPEASIGYGLGHVAGYDPAWVGMPFADIEPAIRKGWEEAQESRGEPQRAYEEYRDYIKEGFERSRARRP